MHTFASHPAPSAARRGALISATRGLLSLGGLATLGATHPVLAQGSAGGDLAILNVALGLDHEGINAYAIALKSGLLDATASQVAGKFRDDHRRHRDALAEVVRRLGGTPVDERSEAEYVKALGLDRLRNQGEVLKLALMLETGAANAYLGVIPSLQDRALQKLVGRLAADEASHAALLNFFLDQPPLPAMNFGA